MKLEFLVIHCTATPAGRVVTKADIEEWHLKERHWKRLGYTDMIGFGKREVINLTPFDSDDEVETWEMTNGVRGINSISRHIVYMGGLDVDLEPADTRTPNQHETLEIYVKYMTMRYPDIKIAGHKQFSDRDCPCFDVPMWLRQIGIPEKNIY